MKTNILLSNLLLLLVSLVLVSACKEPEPVELRNVKFNDLRTQGESLSINTSLRVFNPNSFGATIDKADLLIYVNDREVGAINNIQEFALPGKKESDINLNIDLNASVVQQAVKKEWMKLFTGKELNLIIKGNVNAKMGPLSKKIPVDHKQDIKNMIKELL